ncbi:DUF6356 family protein [Roseobacter sp. HKCCA0434]|uniref:DUF6356 family protein n=1 Tax=Roseobacter sp. HKCCA0434 TaxID=3079297 RepID=UPI002905AA04|nr:DUF6356 family protein [Roseobacter sp. HKCCA0434]
MIAKLFLHHPREVEETYFEHLLFALRFAGLLACAAGAAFVHALIPAFFEKTAGRIVMRLHGLIANRGR